MNNLLIQIIKIKYFLFNLFSKNTKIFINIRDGHCALLVGTAIISKNEKGNQKEILHGYDFIFKSFDYSEANSHYILKKILSDITFINIYSVNIPRKLNIYFKYMLRSDYKNENLKKVSDVVRNFNHLGFNNNILHNTRYFIKNGFLLNNGIPYNYILKFGDTVMSYYLNNELEITFNSFFPNEPSYIKIIDSDTEVMEWFLNGKHHREDGPAIKYLNGDTEWYQNGKRHRIDGPAVEFSKNSENNKYYIDGKKITGNLKYNKLLKIKKITEFKNSNEIKKSRIKLKNSIHFQ